MAREPLDITVDLSIGSDVLKVPSGSVTDCSFELLPFGFSGRLGFWQAFDQGEDPVFPLFTTAEPIEIRVSVCSCLDDPDIDPEALVINGLVTSKSFRETVYKGRDGAPVLQRHYCVDFRDAAQVLWRQHFPALLLSESTWADAIKAQAIKGIGLEMDLPALDVVRPMVCVACGGDELRTSFYDWFNWLADRQAAVFMYDYKSSAYLLTAEKPAKEGDGRGLRPRDVGLLEIVYPEECRWNARLLNAYSDSPKTEEIEQDNSIDGVRADYVVRKAIASDFDARKSLETKRLLSRGREVSVELARFPVKAFAPNQYVFFNDEFSAETACSDGDFRVLGLSFSARAVDTRAEEGKHHETAVFEVSMKCTLEEAERLYVTRPVYKAPRYPLTVEGKIVSEEGDIPDKTYQVTSNPDTSEDEYTVTVPLWGQDIKVVFNPNTLPGHFHFPAFKHSRVLLSLYFDHAVIECFLDQGARVKLPVDTQGNHILFGKNAENETSLRHEFVDTKPEFSIRRVSGVDTELIVMKEGTLVLQTREEENESAGDEVFDLTPKVELTRAALSMATDENIGNVSAEFESTNAHLKGAIEEAVDEAKARLEEMEQEISAKITEVDTKISTMMNSVGEQADALADSVAQAKKELQERVEL